jgi:uncharacterized delta-60 repeat protein
MKKLSLLLLVCLAVVPSSASAAGSLDFDFGRAGKVITPVPLGAPWSAVPVHMAEAPDGGILAAGGEARVIRYLPSGELDPAFGEGGILRIRLPEGGRFTTTDVGVDPEGKVVVIGTLTRTLPPGRGTSSAAVLRLLPDGRLDPGFGGGDGVFTSRFGLSAPAVASQGTVNKWGEITFVVGSLRRTRECGSRPRLREQDRLVAQLDAGGGLHRFFGQDGMQRIAPLREVASMSFSQSGEIYVAGALARECGKAPEAGVISLRPDGDRRFAFGGHGVRRLTGSVAATTVDRHGRIVILFKQRQRPRARDEHFTKVARLLADGSLDRSFDDDGLLVYEFEGPSYKWSSVLIDSSGRILLVGTLIHELPAEKQHGDTRFHRFFMAIPVPERGGEPGGFEGEGWITYSRLGRSSDAAVSDALIDREGELLMAGTARDPKLAPRGGIALARFELWRTS